MACLIFVTEREEVVKHCDAHFQVATRVGVVESAGKVREEIALYDSRSEKEMRAALHNIYKRVRVMEA